MPKRRNVRRVQADYEEMEPTRVSNHRGDRGSKRQQSDSNVLSFNTYVQHRKSVSIIPRSLKQEDYVDLLLDPSKNIVFATGPAGTGKTMLAVLAAIKAYKEGTIEKIIVTRPAVEVEDEKIGFLPGTLNDKMAPWTRPIFDVMKEYYSVKELAYMLEEEIIEISPLAFMRGRSFKKAFIIADEMQNANMNVMKMLLTRFGEGCKMVITGDLMQRDRAGMKDNGLSDFVQRLEKADSNTICSVAFSGKDIQRHSVVTEVLSMYDEI